MPWAVAGAAIAAGGAIGGGILSSNAASSAAGAQSAAANNALGFQEGVYNNTLANLKPYLNTGTTALNSLAGLLGITVPGGTTANTPNSLAAYSQFTQTPYYQFPLQQGIQAMNASGAASGLALSGGQLNSLQQYGQNYASGQLGNYLNALSSLAGMGQNAAALQGSQGNTASNNVLSALLNAGQATSAGIVGSNNATSNTLGSLAGISSNLLNNSTFQNFLSGSGSSYQNAITGSGTNWGAVAPANNSFV